MGYTPNIENPKTLSEKILVRKLYDRRPILVELTDKLKSKEWVTGRSEAIPVPNLEKVEYPCVVKPNNYSGETYIVTTPETWIQVQDHFDEIKHVAFGQKAGSWAYSQIKFKVVIEPFLKGLRDVKFFCFNGKVKFLTILGQRDTITEEPLRPHDVPISYFSPNADLLPVTNRDRPRSYTEFPKDIDLQRMIDCAEKLSEEINFVRVDLYWCNGVIYYGEHTFYPSGGHFIIEPQTYDETFGDYWT